MLLKQKSIDTVTVKDFDIYVQGQKKPSENYLNLKQKKNISKDTKRVQ